MAGPHKALGTKLVARRERGRPSDGPAAAPQSRELRELARRVIWWQEPELTLARPDRFIAQAMTDGTWDEMRLVRAAYGDDALRRVLADAPPGVFDPRSWTYWHVSLGIEPVPPIPRRRLGG